jgi:hypothetical protein
MEEQIKNEVIKKAGVRYLTFMIFIQYNESRYSFVFAAVLMAVLLHPQPK